MDATNATYGLHLNQKNFTPYTYREIKELYRYFAGQENELRIKSARLAELNIALNIDDKTPLEALADEAPVRTEVAKSAKPSVLQKLHSYDKPSKTEPTKKHKEEVL